MITKEILEARKRFRLTNRTSPKTLTLPKDKFDELKRWADSTATTCTAPDGSKCRIQGMADSVYIGGQIYGMTILEPSGEEIVIGGQSINDLVFQPHSQNWKKADLNLTDEELRWVTPK